MNKTTLRATKANINTRPRPAWRSDSSSNSFMEETGGGELERETREAQPPISPKIKLSRHNSSAGGGDGGSPPRLPAPSSSYAVTPLSIERPSPYTRSNSSNTAAAASAATASDRILQVRLEIPVEGVENQPHVYSRLLSNRVWQFTYSWLRSKVKRTCDLPSCSHSEVASLQDLVTGKRYCSRACMLEASKKSTKSSSTANTTKKKKSVEELSRRLDDPLVDCDPTDHAVWNIRPFVENDEWVEVGQNQIYTPNSQDVGHVLKCLVSASSGAAADVLRGCSEETHVVIGLPPQVPKRRLLVAASSSTTTPAATGETTGGFRIVTYNILADIYASLNNGLAFADCPKWALNWKFRRVQLMRELAMYDADILCLQEVQQDHYQLYLLPLLESLGYEGIYKAKTRLSTTGQIDGCATLFKRSRFTMLTYYEVEFNKAAHQMAQQGAFASSSSSRGGNANNPNSNVNDASTQECLKRLCKDNVAQILILQTVSDSQPQQQLCLANTHLFWDPECPDVKLWQAHYLLQELEGIAGLRMMPRYLPLVLCGDFNSMPDSAVYELLSRERVKADHPDLIADKVGILPSVNMLSHTLGLVSAAELITGNEVEITNYTISFVGALDYIWCNEGIQAVSMLEMPSVPEMQGPDKIHCPNGIFPSDHLAIVADFRFADQQQQQQQQQQQPPPQYYQ